MNATGTITVQRCGSFDDVDADQWNELLMESATRSIFQTHQWHRTWWRLFKTADRELVLLVASQRGKPVGIASLYIDQHRAVRFIGHGRSDYSDLICPSNREDVRCELLKQVVAECAPWKRMILRHLPSESPTSSTLDASGMRFLQTDSVPCPTLIIDEQPEFLQQARSKKSLRRHHNYFRKQSGYHACHLRRADEILPLLDAFFDQHIARWSVTEYPSLFNDEINRRFFREMVQSLDATDHLRFTRLSIGDHAIAFHFGLAFAGTFYWYKPSFDPNLAAKSPGEALLKELLDFAAEDQCREFDFTIGDEAFKQRFANRVRQNVEMTAYASAVDFRIQSAALATKRYLHSNRLGRPFIDFAKRIVGR